MAMPKVLDWLDELVAKVATNTANIAKNASDIAENKKLFDTHVADDERHWTTEDRNNFDRVVHFKGYFVSIEKLKEAYPTGQLGDYAIVGGTDTVWLWDDESNSWLNSTEQGIVISVNGRTGEVILTKTDVGLSNVDNTADKDKPISTAQQTALNAKADRKKITLAQADSLGLRAGIYYIDNESKRINDFTASYWTVIVAERATGTNASATQIWMNYNSNSTQHIYMRKQQNGSSWSEFREILTDIHYSELDTKIQTNIEDIGDLQVNKANRGIITLEQANAITGLKSGIYSIEGASIKILDITDNYWTVVQGDWTDGGAVQIWIPFSTGQKTAMYWRHQTKDTDYTTRIWGEFSKVGTSSDISNLQSQITTNKNNIATNKTNITKNTNDITTLKDDRAERKRYTVEELDQLNIRAGIYEVYNQQKEILGVVDKYWTVIVGENTGNTTKYSASQVWINWSSAEKPHMFLRIQKNAESGTGKIWTDFVEILTTDIATREDINRFKQYKGYYALLSDLRTDFPTATDGDYAIVGSALYIWNSKSSSWNEVSGSGGSTGTGKWSIRQYDTPDYTSQFIPQFKDIVGKTLDKQWEIEDTTDYFFNQDSVSNKCFLFETYVNMEEETSFSSTTLVHDDGINVYVNGISTYSQKATSASSQQTSLTINLEQGWNKIQILLCEVSGGESFRLGIKFTDNAKCLGMDCYHAETEPVLGYVPLVGDSTIEGNITIEGTVGVTSNSYLQYNSSDDSLSFMFNN